MSTALLLQNIFRQLSQEAVRVSQSATASHVIEELVQLADKAQLTSLLEQFSADWETVCCDQYASHVTQAAVNRCTAFLSKALSSFFATIDILRLMYVIHYRMHYWYTLLYQECHEANFLLICCGSLVLN